MRQETLTLVAPLSRVERVRKIVESYARDKSKVAHVLGRGNAQPKLFQGLGIHFARIVVVDEPSTSPYRAVLLLDSNFDTTHEDGDSARRAHLALLARERGDVLRELWSDAREPLPREDGAAFEATLARCLVPHTAAYQGHVFRELARIEQEAQIRDVALQCAARLPRALSDAEVLREVRARVCSELRLDLECDAPGLPDPARRRELMLHPKRAWRREAIPFLLAGAACLPLTVLLAALLLYRERNDRPYDLQSEAESVGPELLRRLAASSDSEDYGTQNALTHLVPVRGGFGRNLTLRVTHAYLAKVAQNHFNYVEQLGGIPSIHFAKWLLVDGGRRLLFFSNYDGSWESYLGDFVDQAALGLNLAWMCTEGYPNTRFVGDGGANDEETFKAWARVHQRPTELFYSAYPALSVADVNNNSWLRCGLHRGGPDDIERWIRRFT